MTARDGLAAGGGIGFAETKVTIAPLAGPFQVTSHARRAGHLRHLLADRHVGRRGHGRRADQRRQREDLAVHGRRPDLPDDARGEHAQRRLGRRHVPGTSPPTKARIKVEAIGQRLLRRLRRRLSRSTAAPTTPVGGTVPATLSLTLGTPGTFGAFTPGVTKTYFASTSANVISTAGDALLSVADPSTNATGHLVNGTFSLPQPLQARARNAANTGTAYNNVGSSGLAAEPADVQRAGLQRRGDAGVQPADQRQRCAPYRYVLEDADLHAEHHHAVAHFVAVPPGAATNP